MSNYAPPLIITSENQWPDNDHNFWPRVQNIIEKGFEESKHKFKSWFPVQRIPIYNPLFGIVETAYIGEVLSFLRDHSDKEKWLEALRESFIGHTAETYEQYTTPLTKEKIPVSAWTVKTAAHLIKFLSINKLHNLRRYERIIELGAGIGEMARMIHKAELFDGNYTIVDFPAISKISNFYNQQNGVDVEVINNINDIVVDNSSSTLVIGTWSINEMPVHQRNDFLKKVAGCDFMMTYSLNILGLQNSHYFASDFVKIVGTPITHLEFIPYHPFDGGNYYMFCVQ